MRLGQFRFLGIFLLFLPFASFSYAIDGFLPKNELRIPINQKSFNGIDENQFNQILNKIQN